MSGGSGRPRDWSVDSDFCVVATSVHRPRKSASPAAGLSFPDLRRFADPPRTPLLQQRAKYPENCAGSFIVRCKLAPFAGKSCAIPTKHHVDPLPDTSTSSSAFAFKSRVSTKAPVAHGNSMHSDICCCKSEGRVSGAQISGGESLGGRGRLTLSSVTTAPNDDGSTTTPVASSTTCNAECTRASRLEVLSGDVLVQICDYIQVKDMIRVSTVSRAMFDGRLWQQLHLVRYGMPNIACLKGLPFARTSRLQLESDFPIHHARLFSIRHHHEGIRSKVLLDGACCPRLMFAAAALTREDTFLREQEEGSRLERAESRRKQHTTRAFRRREMASAKRASTEERMAMVDMRSAVERHAYAPGCRPKAPPPASPWQDDRARGGRGKAKREASITSPSLTGVFMGGGRGPGPLQ